MGLSINLFLYVFINMAMGLISVVGMPLLPVSCGGTAMIAVMASIGLIISVYVHRDVKIPRAGVNTGL